MKVGLDRIVEQPPRQAPDGASDKVKREIPPDSGTERKHPAAPNGTSPDVAYHEIKLDGTLRPSGDGGFFFRSLSPSEFCEQVKINAHKRAAELRAADMEKMHDSLKTELAVFEPALAEKSFGFSIDETGLIRPIALSGELTQREESLLSRLMNENKAFSEAAGEYIWMLAGLVDRTLEGLSAPYARHFSPAEKGGSRPT